MVAKNSVESSTAQELRYHSLLRVHSLRVSFGPTRALEGASLEVAEGEMLALLGPSGSGKSTLLHCTAGLLTPDSGEVHYAGQRVDQLSDTERSRLRREEFGFVFQFGSLVPELSARENVAFPLRLLGWRRRAAEGHADEWLERFGIGDVADRLPGQMSGGQGQRVALARALITKPRVVFADEPTGALDSVNGAIVADALIHAAREQGAAVLLVTHDAAVAARADRRVTMHDGGTEGPGAER
jgi:putative ABC transport system ATP-binding protein